MKTLYLEEAAYIDGREDADRYDEYVHYEAHAHDDDGHAFFVRWELTDEQLELIHSPDYDGDESDACDWDKFVVFAENGDEVGDESAFVLVDKTGVHLGGKAQ